MGEPIATSDLREHVRRGDAVIIAGAGVAAASSSVAATGSWRAMLLSLFEHATQTLQEPAPGWFDRVRDEMHSSDLDDVLSAAEKLERKLGGNNGRAFRRWLRTTFERASIDRPELLDAILDTGAPILTTNYDSLFERRSHREPTTWRHPAQVQQVIAGRSDKIVHLHGHWEDPSSVVLGIRDYESILGAEFLQVLLQSCVALKSLVLVGCGGTRDDPNLGALFRWAVEVAGQSGHDHYVLVSQRQLAEQPLSDDGPLVPIVYGNEHEDLAPYLAGLGRSQRSSMSAPQVREFGSAPAPPTLAVGRSAETEALAEAMSQRSGPILVLGPPGVGKSHSLLRALELVRARQAPSVIAPLYVRCDLFDSVASIELRLRSALGLPEGSPFRLAFSRYHDGPAHVVLDNAESAWLPDPLAFEALMADLAATPELLTTVAIRGVRRPAGVAWGSRFSIHPLEPHEARELFVTISGIDEAEEGLDRVVGLGEGLPLVIELLALALPGVGSLDELQRTWGDCSRRLSLLERPPASGRESSLRIALEVSQTGFDESGSDLAVAALLARMPGGMWSQAFEQLGLEYALAARNLCERGLAEGGGHLTMLAPICAYFETTTSEPTALAGRVASYVCDSIAKRAGRLTENDRHVIDWSIDHLAGSGPLDLNTIEAAIVSIVDHRERDLPISRSTRKVAECDLDAADPATSSRFLLELGLAELRRSQQEPSRQHLLRARSIAVAADLALLRANCDLRLGELDLRASSQDSAEQRIRQALADFVSQGDRRGEADATLELATFQFWASQFSDAETNLRLAIEGFDSTGDAAGRGWAMLRRAEIALRQTDWQASATLANAAELAFREAYSVRGRGHVELVRGTSAMWRTDMARAEQHFDAALTDLRACTDHAGVATVYRSIAEIAIWRSDHVVALELLEKARGLYLSVSHALGRAHCDRLTSEILVADGEVEQAAELNSAAAQIYLHLGNYLNMGHVWLNAARLRLRAGDPDGSLVCCGLAKANYDAVGSARGRASALMVEAYAVIERGDTPDVPGLLLAEAAHFAARAGDERLVAQIAHEQEVFPVEGPL